MKKTNFELALQKVDNIALEHCSTLSKLLTARSILEYIYKTEMQALHSSCENQRIEFVEYIVSHATEKYYVEFCPFLHNKASSKEFLEYTKEQAQRSTLLNTLEDKAGHFESIDAFTDLGMNLNFTNLEKYI